MNYQTQKWEVPEETARIAKAAFPKGAPFIKMRDEMGVIYKNSEFKELFSHRGKRGEAPGNLALVLIMQYAEGLTDEQAAEAVRGRIDWKYGLGLELTDKGFDTSVLSRFRKRLLEKGEEMKLLDHMLKQFVERGWVDYDEQRTDATHVLAAVRRLNRLEVVGETMRAALSALAIVVPQRVKEQITPEWFERYGARFEAYRLPQKEAEIEQMRLQIGQDGYQLLTAIYEQQPEENEIELKWIPAVQILRQVWVQQYYLGDTEVAWREAANIAPASKLIESPYDAQARYSRKRETKWVGYKVHITETCQPKTPHLITHVITTTATEPDAKVVEELHVALEHKEMLPQTHYVDTGYVNATNLSRTKQKKIDLFGPTPPDTSWQKKEGKGFALSQFIIDWEQKVALCPQGEQSHVWSESHDSSDNKVIHIQFKKQLCQTCPTHSQCTTAQTTGRTLKLRDRDAHTALQLARQRQEEVAFKKQYRRRAGVEGSISQGVRSFHLRSCRYIGLPKTHLQHILIAAAMNMTRIVCWLRGDRHARTRITPFSALALNFT